MIGGSILALALAAAQSGSSPAPKPQSLQQLYEQVRDEARQEARESKARELAFEQQKHLQAETLRAAKAQLQAERARFETLSQAIEAGSKTLDEKRAQLDKSTGDLGELFGVMRKIGGEASGLIKTSLLSTQYPGQSKAAQTVAGSKELASQEQIEALWQSILWNMVKSGTVETFSGSLIAKDGTVRSDEKILRVGTFSAFANGEYLRFLPTGDAVKLIELSRQPPATFREQAAILQGQKIGEPAPVSLDPSRGAVVELLVQSPSWKERIAQGGVIGFIILALGALGLLIAVERLVYLGLVGLKIRKQAQRPDTPKRGNPLGRLLLVAQSYPDIDAEALLLRFEEALSRELPRLRRGLAVITLFATTAPLLGLLGTVTGMIATFQSITLFGNGDPKMMSGGISQALVTTELGLATSIPLMLIHALVSTRAGKLAQTLDDASTRKVAQRLSPAASSENEASS